MGAEVKVLMGAEVKVLMGAEVVSVTFKLFHRVEAPEGFTIITCLG